MAPLAVMVRIPRHPCAAALVDTNDSYNCCSGAVDSGHEDFSRVRRDIERHCVGVGSLSRVSFFLELEVMNKTKVSPGNEQAIAPGTQGLLWRPVGEIVGRGIMDYGGRLRKRGTLGGLARTNNTRPLFCTSHLLVGNAILGASGQLKTGAWD